MKPPWRIPVDIWHKSRIIKKKQSNTKFQTYFSGKLVGQKSLDDAIEATEGYFVKDYLCILPFDNNIT